MQGIHRFRIRGSTPHDTTIEVDGIPDLTIKRIAFTVGVDSPVAEVTVTYDAEVDADVHANVTVVRPSCAEGLVVEMTSGMMTIDEARAARGHQP